MSRDGSHFARATALGFVPEWFDFGFLSEDDIYQHEQNLTQGLYVHDEETARLEQFFYHIDTAVLTNEFVDAVTRLAEADGSYNLGVSVLIRLSRREGITEVHMERLRRSSLAQDRSLQKALADADHIRRAPSATELQLLEMAASASVRVQEYMLGLDHLPESVLQLISGSAGANRRLRHQAKALLRRRGKSSP